jgi:hypothetical protein
MVNKNALFVNGAAIPLPSVSLIYEGGGGVYEKVLFFVWSHLKIPLKTIYHTFEQLNHNIGVVKK